MKSIKSALAEFQNINAEQINGRIYVRKISRLENSESENIGFTDVYEIEKIKNKLEKVFGLVSISIALKSDKKIEDIEKCAKEVFDTALLENANLQTFKIQARRSDKEFALDSVELNRHMGGYILDEFPQIRVDVHNPGITIYVEIREKAYVYTDITPSAGGMPLSTNGKAVLLLSGGIDSPVAGHMVAKRGVEIVAVHFYSFPYTGEQSKQKVVDLAKILSEYCGGLKLYIVPFTQIQQEIFEKCSKNYLTIVMRCFMMKISQKVALKEEAKALITGESIGQVASQTMDSLYVTDNAVTLPIFRPLIGMDKVEVMERARNIGTYETSILPFEDCCTIFTPKNPAIYPTIEKTRECMEALDVEKLIEEAVIGAEVLMIKPY